MATCKALPFSSYSFAAILNPRNLSEKPKSFTFDYSYWSHNEVGISNVHTIKVNPLPWTRLEIMVAWLPVKMTSQIKFNSVIPHFWPVKYNNVIFPLYRFQHWHVLMGHGTKWRFWLNLSLIPLYFFLGWSPFCITEKSLCRYWQRNVGTCIWGVCITCMFLHYPNCMLTEKQFLSLSFICWGFWSNSWH